MLINHALQTLQLTTTRIHSSPTTLNLFRGFALWSMKKDPELESALSRNKRWIVNNQIKNIILRYPNQAVPIKFLQKKFKTLDLQGKALNWVKKYPCCFEVYQECSEYHCSLTKRMMYLVEEEESVKDTQEPVFAERLAKLLMMSSNHRLNVIKLNELNRNFGFPDDFVIRLVPKYPEMFRLINHCGRRSSMEIELLSWKPELAVSTIETLARKQNVEPRFSCLLPSTWVKSWERFNEFNSTPYISPYSNPSGLIEGLEEKRTVGLLHELLSLTLWKKLSILKLGHFRREFGLPEKLNILLLKHPGIFYVSNKYQIYTVLLREGYHGSELVQKDPLVVIKENFGELMQEGLHEYNQRRRLVNIEKKKKKGFPISRKGQSKDENLEITEEDTQVGRVGGLFDPEERKRFYKVLFDDDPNLQQGCDEPWQFQKGCALAEFLLDCSIIRLNIFIYICVHAWCFNAAGIDIILGGLCNSPSGLVADLRTNGPQNVPSLVLLEIFLWKTAKNKNKNSGLVSKRVLSHGVI